MKKENIIISPLDFRHFILDIPKVNMKYQKQTVAFALKSFYPGTEDNTSIDYAYKKSGVIGIAVSKSKLQTIKNGGNKLISPTLVVSNSFDNGIFITFAAEWIEVQVIDNGNLLELHSYSSFSIIPILDWLKRTKDVYSTLPVTLINFESEIMKLESECSQLDIKFTTLMFADLLNNSVERKATIFENKKSKSTANVYYISLFLFILVSTFVSIFTYKNKSSYEKKASELRFEYNTLKNKEHTNTQKKDDQKPTYKQVCSIHEILSEIVDASETIIISSFSYTNGNLRLEAENTNAISVLDKLKKSKNIYDVTLVQSYIRDDGSEKFIITGKIK